MSNDSSPERRPGSGRLWTEPREEEEHQPWLRPRAPGPDPTPHEPHPTVEMAPPQRRRLWRTFALSTLVAIVLVGAGALGARLLGGDTPSQQAVSPLPVVPGAAPADQRIKTVREIYASASPSVVRVHAQQAGAQGIGTGFVIDSAGTIVTNAHVVGDSRQVQVRFEDDGDGIDAEVLGSDASSDLAVLKIDPAQAGRPRPLALADSDKVQVGDLAVAIGFPLNLDKTLTQGIVSGVGRAIEAPNGFRIDKVIQTDAPINPGNSGGPLLNSAGRVIGVNSQIATAGGGGNVGIGFAVPSNTVSQIVPRLKQGGSIRRPYLGVSTLASTGRPGALVAEVRADSPALAAGVQPGDVISRVGDAPVRAPEDISTAIEARAPGDQVDLEIQRAGATRTLRVQLGTRPETSP